MIIKIINGKELQFNDTLRVMYNLKSVFGVTTFQEVLTKLQRVEFDDQLAIIYEAYKASPQNDVRMTREEFIDFCLDNLGIISINNLSQDIIGGLVYAGTSKEEKDAAEKNAEELLAKPEM